MIQIIAGKYKGRRLAEISHPKVRPTQARVRKSMLQILEPFNGMKVLDIFSGVGTLGIEAVSRGADLAVMVERSGGVFSVLRKNVESICRAEEVQLHKADARQFVRTVSDQFDIIIADPPYQHHKFYEIREMIEPLLKSGGRFCMEMAAAPILADNESLRIKKYGRTQVVFWEKD